MPVPVSVHVYCSAGGRSPVLEWLVDRSIAEFDLCQILVEELRDEGPGLGWPDSKPLGRGLFELRGHVGTVQLRMLYFFRPGAVVVIAAGFVKKGPSIIDKARKLAEQRRREVDQDPGRHLLALTTEELRALRERRRKR